MNRGPLVVVGDLLLDEDVEGEAGRLAPDAPVPVVDVTRVRRRPGGAGLAALLAAEAGAEVVLVTALGTDAAGDAARRALGDRVRIVALPLDGTLPVKTRVLAGGRPLVRLDRGGGRPGRPGADALAALRAARAVLVSDYGRGTADVLREALTEAAARVPLVWDPHPRGGPPVPGTCLATPNAKEAAAFAPEPPSASASEAVSGDPRNPAHGARTGSPGDLPRESIPGDLLSYGLSPADTTAADPAAGEPGTPAYGAEPGAPDDLPREPMPDAPLPYGPAPTDTTAAADSLTSEPGTPTYGVDPGAPGTPFPYELAPTPSYGPAPASTPAAGPAAGEPRNPAHGVAPDAPVPAGDIASSPAASSLRVHAERGAALARGWRATYVAVTLGADGALLTRAGSAAPLLVPAVQAGGGDPCGAGDCFAAAVTVALADGALPAEAVERGVAQAAAFVAAGGAAAVPDASAGRRPAGSRDRAPDAFALARAVRSRGGTVVATGGCFDLLHAGHVGLLERAGRIGDCLIVCVNSDASLARLKGPGRPLTPLADRMRVLAALGSVDAVVSFDEDTPERLLARLRPDVWVKGGDYSADGLPETEVLRRWGGQTVVLPYLDGRSTTSLADRAARAAAAIRGAAR
ncbi:D-glycero-beta-D-manno-heptose 1-phosphate adenylyltransferase [Streptomyces sp. NPDC053493]|uniref:D-glycero-beta-D-manno-heptose 1-phosphate adenylyltransferase n=1 Tax=Streptomyces sp. NPDC053493 TaxID=3365705 RepID=UPI0037CDA3BC